ncbi:hypothetical protein R70006_06321 [Paraburkholderia domus]|uniref:hypothetical protein n=1 Tax=Paraburkholderia domus TaxID=2793075 RepID=UPI001911D831|nr:hypothetical protein [Paraburkholderia domus]MBK5052946.1 hypothetical protein [Burkholderia sp. R-70006]CAE6823504.1 hypothetical protein R70006_06321 [Paraburkholderia domus]
MTKENRTSIEEQSKDSALNAFAQPSREFDAFVHDLTRAHLEATRKDPADVFERKLWSAAEFDWHRQTGEVKQMLDAGGLPRGEVDAYARMIKIAVNAIPSRT